MQERRLVAQILDCTACELSVQVLPVPFSGEPGRIAVLGEAPGEQEDDVGRPFVGPAGQLLRRLLDHAGFEPNDLAYVNTVSCFPHGAPSWDHIRSCERNKLDQLDYLDPTFVLLLGKVALRSMRPDLDISQSRSRPFIHGRICFASYHPAAALRNAKYERGLKRDLAVFRQLVDAEDWQALIPDDCSRCEELAVAWESTGLGWCEPHMPESLRGIYDPRRRQVVEELESARRRDEALAQVADAADPNWMAAAWDALVEYLRTHEVFFSDEFWSEANLPRPKESRALGPVILRAAREGLMRKSGQFRKSVASHMTEKPVWDSLIYRPEP